MLFLLLEPENELDQYLKLMLRIDNPIYLSLLLTFLIFFIIYYFVKHVLIPVESKFLQEKHKLEERDIILLERYERQLKELNAHLQDTLEEERRRIAYELHDSLGQNLSLVKLIVEKYLRKTQDADDQQGITKAISLLDTSINELKDIAHNLNPRAIEEVGLSPALIELCNLASINGKLMPAIDIEKDLHKLPARLELCIYRVTQEALNNILKHSEAREFNLRLNIVNNTIRLVISDDGKGFNPEEVYSGKNKHSGMGLITMRHRVEQFGGILKIESSENQGTMIIVDIPQGGDNVFEKGDKSTDRR